MKTRYPYIPAELEKHMHYPEEEIIAEKAVDMFMALMLNEVNRSEKREKIKSPEDYFNYLVDADIEDTNTVLEYFEDKIDEKIKEKMKAMKYRNYQIPEDKREEPDDPESWDDCLEFPEDYEDDPINELLFGHHGVEYR